MTDETGAWGPLPGTHDVVDDGEPLRKSKDSPTDDVRTLIEEERRHLAENGDDADGREQVETVTNLAKAVTDLAERLAEVERTVEERDELIVKLAGRVEALEAGSAVKKSLDEGNYGEPVAKGRGDVFDVIAARVRAGHRDGSRHVRVEVNPTA